jgi:hypothetical protein
MERGNWILGLRHIIETTYAGRMTVYRRVFQTENGRTVQKDLVSILNQPCALSWGGGFQKRGTAVEQQLSPVIRGQARIFTAPDLDIPAGSRIVVTQYGKTTDFISSGEGVVYPTHQELIVEREDFA